VVETFGERVLSLNGEIDRKKLGEIVFNNPSALATLNDIIHPRAYELTKSRLEEFRKQGVEVVVLEVILLVEAGWDHLADEIWVTVAAEDTVVERLQESRGLTKEEILTRIHAQTPNKDRIKYADVIIENDGSYEELKTKLREFWHQVKGENLTD
jgi:dephospho-CoA kinase